MSAVSIGNALKDARAKKAVTLEEVHARIKIHPRVLQLLEDGKFDKLPSPLFVKSFLRSYAEFLEINPEELVEAYEKEDKKIPEQILFIRPADPYAGRPFLDKSLLAGIAFVAVVALAAVGVFYAFKTKAQWGVSVKAKQASHETVPAAVAHQKKRALESKTASEWLRSVELGNFPRLGRKAPLELRIRAMDSVWLRVTCDGKVLFQSILKRGATESWKASDTIELWTGNSSSMNLSLNNYPLGSPGKGVIKKLTISREGVRIPAS